MVVTELVALRKKQSQVYLLMDGTVNMQHPSSLFNLWQYSQLLEPFTSQLNL